jgi:hypothetical protein
MKSNIADIQTIFANIAAHGVDVGLPVKWGHFFCHAVLEPLREFLLKLQGSGYTFESAHQADSGACVLQVSKTEIRSIRGLHDVYISLNRLAEENGIDSYDGWDVGKPDLGNVLAEPLSWPTDLNKNDDSAMA